MLLVDMREDYGMHAFVSGFMWVLGACLGFSVFALIMGALGALLNH
jgi:hypothetical protein